MADALRSLAGLLRTGLSVRLALSVWHEEAGLALRGALTRLSRRLCLGDTITRAVRSLADDFGDDAITLSAILSVHSDLGGDVARMIDGMARWTEERGASAESARAAAAGARLSARLISWLPLAFIPLIPLGRAPLLDKTGLALLGAGMGLAAAGIAWIGRLLPKQPVADDGAAMVADLTASVVRGGVGLDEAFDFVSRHAPADIHEDMARARRLVQFGARWGDALGAAARQPGSGLTGLATAVRRSQAMGLPVADALEAFAARRRAERQREFDAAMKRAPVLMVIPLVLCVLPSFILLGLAPFLRGLSLRP